MTAVEYCEVQIVLAICVPRAAYAARCANDHTSVSDVKHGSVRLAYMQTVTNVTPITFALLYHVLIVQ